MKTKVLLCGLGSLLLIATHFACKEPTPTATKVATDTSHEPTYQGQPVSYWLKLMSDTDAKTRRLASEALVEIARGDIDSKFIVTSANTIWSLTNAVIPTLDRAFRDSNPWVRYNAGVCHFILTKKIDRLQETEEWVALCDYSDIDLMTKVLSGFGFAASERELRIVEKLISNLSTAKYRSERDKYVLMLAKSTHESIEEKMRAKKQEGKL